MPNYTSVLEVYRVCPHIGSLTTISSANVCSFIDDAEAIMNAKLSRNYTVPMSSVPLLSVLAADIAAARIMTRRAFTQEKINKSAWVEKYEESMKMLDAIANGDINLLTSSGDEITESGNVMMSNTMNYTPTFLEDGDVYSIIDDDKLDAIDRG